MRAKPEMKPLVYTDKSRMSSVGAALTERAFGLCRCGPWLCIRWESAAPTGLNKCVPMINPGLAPWAMKMYRPCRAHLHLPNQLLGYFDARTLFQGYSTLSSPINILYCFNALTLVSGGTPAKQQQTAVQE